MIMFDIAEWIAKVLVLGIGVFFWVLAIGLFLLMVVSVTDKMTGKV